MSLPHLTLRDLGCVRWCLWLKSHELLVNFLHDQRGRPLVKVGQYPLQLSSRPFSPANAVEEALVPGFQGCASGHGCPQGAQERQISCSETM